MPKYELIHLSFGFMIMAQFMAQRMMTHLFALNPNSLKSSYLSIDSIHSNNPSLDHHSDSLKFFQIPFFWELMLVFLRSFSANVFKSSLSFCYFSFSSKNNLCWAEFNSILKETWMYTLEIVVLFPFKLAHSRKYSFSYLKSYHFHDGTKRSRSSQIRKNLKSISILLEAKPASEVVRMNLLKLNKSRPGPATASSVKKGSISTSQEVMLDLRLWGM